MSAGASGAAAAAAAAAGRERSGETRHGGGVTTQRRRAAAVPRLRSELGAHDALFLFFLMYFLYGEIFSFGPCLRSLCQVIFRGSPFICVV